MDVGGAYNVKTPKRQFMGQRERTGCREGLDAVQGAVLSLSNIGVISLKST